MLKKIPGFPDYYASDSGEIYSSKPLGGYHGRGAKRPDKPRLLKKCLIGKGDNTYYAVGISRDNKRKTMKIPPLILTTFVSRRPKGKCACHGARGHLDDSIDNLYWATPKQNMKDKIRDHTNNYACGEMSGSAKLNEMQVRVIRRAYSPRGKDGISSRQLAIIFNVKQPCISRIVNKINWSHV